MSINRHLSINDVRLPPDLIKGYTLESLKELNNQDEGSFFEFFQGLDLEDVKTAQQRREGIQDDNRKLAMKTCELQPKFDELKSELRQKSTKVDELRDSYVRKYEELKELQKRRDENAMKSQLTQAVKEVENKSEDMAADFIAGKSDLSADDFKENFLSLRQIYWTRKVKAEKLAELLKNKRPQAHPRVPRNQMQPYVQPQNPAQSLPAHVQHQSAPYPVELRCPSEPTPTLSMPAPYAVPPNVSMPRPPPPGHVFSSVPTSYPGYPMRSSQPPTPYAPYTHKH